MARPVRFFAYVLAEKLGWVGPIDDLVAQYSSADLTEWRAYFALQADAVAKHELARRAEAGAQSRLEALRQE